MDPPELASEPPRSRIKLRAGVKSIGLGNVRGSTPSSTPISVFSKSLVLVRSC